MYFLSFTGRDMKQAIHNRLPVFHVGIGVFVLMLLISRNNVVYASCRTYNETVDRGNEICVQTVQVCDEDIHCPKWTIVQGPHDCHQKVTS